VRLDVDLAFDAAPGRTSSGVDTRALDLHTLAGALRSPRRLALLLRDQAYDDVYVHEGDLPRTALQAVCLVAIATARSSRFVVEERALGRPGFLFRALVRTAVAVPSELLRSTLLAQRLLRASRRPARLPKHAAETRKALYLRVDPSLRWLGMQVGGAATHTTGVINGFAENGVEVEVLAAERPVGTERARFVQVPARRVLHLIGSLTYADYGEDMVDAAAELSADFVYQRYQLGTDAGLSIARRLRVPLVLEFNGSELWIERHWRSGRTALGGVLGQVERRNLIDASLVVVVSEALREIALALGAAPERVLVNPNGVDLDALAPYRALSAARWRAHAGLPDSPTVGFIGTFGRWHGVTLLPALVEAVPEARWVIVGDGELFPKVKADIEARGLAERVVMTGVVERPQALELLSCADVFVSPHVRNEDATPFFGSPTKLFEYMGLQKPIVASDLDQIGQILEHERTALLCEPGDIDEAAAAIRRLLLDPVLRTRLAKAALELAGGHYTWKAHVRRILDALAPTAVVDEAGGVGNVSA